MPQFEKFLSDVGPDDPPARAAQRALKTRLRAVVVYLQQAVKSTNQVETIHQLRIWSRRSTAALKLFAPLLPPRKTRKLKKQLRLLRQTAGQARDWDVVQAQLGPTLHGPLARRLVTERQAADDALQRFVRQWGASGKLNRKVMRLLKRLKARTRAAQSNGAAFGPWCRAELTPLVKNFSRCAAGGLRQSDTRLHQWRLAAKRLRYALEMSVAALPKQVWSRFYKLLTNLQERLGRVCDALLEQRQLRELWKATDDPAERAVLQSLLSRSRQRLAAAKTALARWWTSKRWKSAQALCRQAAGVS